MTRSLSAALAVLATVTLAACSEGGAKTADGRVAAGLSAPVAQSFEDLSQALDISVPEGYLRQPDTVDDTGPSDLEKASRDDGGDDARDVLTKARFVRGYQRMWSRSEDDEILVYVYQFADSAGATEYTARLTVDAGTPVEGMTTATFTVPTIDGAVGMSASDPTFASSSVIFVKGPYSVQTVVNGTSPTGLQSLATALAEEQHSRL